MLAPAGAPGSSEYVNVLAGISGSVAVTVSVIAVPSLTDRSPIGANTGGRFTSLTVTVKVFASLRLGEPLSLTRTVMVMGVVPTDASGIHVNTPVVALMWAPAGAPGSKLYVSRLAGISGSIAAVVI